MYGKSEKKVLKTPQKNIRKSRSRTTFMSQSNQKPFHPTPQSVQQVAYNPTPSNTSEKYLILQLTQSNQKQNQMSKMLQSKDQRIKQLQGQIKENQQFVQETLRKWKKWEECERSQCKELRGKIYDFNLQITQMSESHEIMTQEIKTKQQEFSKVKEQKVVIQQKYAQLQSKYEKLKKRYLNQREQWKQTVPLILQMITQMKNSPEEQDSSNQHSFEQEYQ